MSDWAKRTNEKLEKQEADRNAKREFYVLQRKQFDSEAPRLWEELKEKLFKEVTAFGKLRPNYLSMEADYQGLQKITLQAPKAFLDISFQAATPAIDYKLRNKTGSSASSSGYVFEISDGQVVFTGLDHGHVGAQVIAEDLLEKLIAYSGPFE